MEVTTGIDKMTRTYLLSMLAVLLGVVGFVAALVDFGPQMRPRTMLRQAAEAPLQVISTIQGLPPNYLGWPGQVAVATDRIFVVDRMATEAMIKVFSPQGEFMYGFGALGREGLAQVMDITLDPVGNVVVLDASPAIVVYSPEGDRIRRMDLAHFDERFILDWATSIIATESEFFVLSLDRLLRIDLRGRVLSATRGRQDEMFLGVSPSEFHMGPSGLVVREGRVWVADSVHGRLIRLGERGEFDLALPLPKTGGTTPYPTSVALDAEGNFLVVDAATQMLVALSPEGAKMWEIRLNQLLENQTRTDIADIADIALGSGGRIYVSNFLTGKIESFSVSNGRQTGRQEIIAARARFLLPRDIVVDGNALYILSAQTGVNSKAQIYRHDLALGVGTTIIRADIDGAVRLAARNNLLYVLTERRILVFSQAGRLQHVIGEDSSLWGGFGVVSPFGTELGPQAIEIDGEGRIWVSDTFRHRLLIFAASGEFSHEVTLGAEIWPAGMAFRPDNTLLILNPLVGQIIHIDQAGQVLGVHGERGSGLGQLGVLEDMGFLGGANDIAADSQGGFYVVDTINNRVQQFSPEARPSFAQGNFGSGVGQVFRPQALAYYPAQGAYFLADGYNHRVKLVQFR